ncbi:MAG: type II toxin-antitoxin system VapC family toxin [Bryobacteraceae bacterium]
MTIFYVDSSAWLKRYFDEPGTGWMASLFEREERLTSSVLGYVEVASALARQQVSRKLGGPKLAELRKRLEADWADMGGLPLTSELAEQAASLSNEYRLRGADAVHLTTVLSLKDSLSGSNDSVRFVASDRELLEAARRAGMEADDPIFKV